MRRKCFLFWLIGVTMALAFSTTSAEPIAIAASGGSNIFGKNLPRSEAYPAQLEAQLRAKGYDVVVRNEGTNGQTTADELAKVDVVIFNDVCRRQ